MSIVSMAILVGVGVSGRETRESRQDEERQSLSIGENA